MTIDTDFWYLASPYSKYEAGLQEAYELALKAQWLLIDAGVRTYSPIVATHQLAIISKHDPRHPTLWEWCHRPYLILADGLVVLRGKGWQQSVGVTSEITEARRMHKPVHYMEPGQVPLALRSWRDNGILP